MSYFNQRGIFLQLMQPSPSEPNALVSLQLARKELSWDAENERETYSLVDSVFFTATETIRDNASVFEIKYVDRDIDGDRDIDAVDKAKLEALAKAYANIVNP